MSMASLYQLEKMHRIFVCKTFGLKTIIVDENNAQKR